MRNGNCYILLISFAFVLVGCSSIKKDLIPTNNAGGYKVLVVQKQDKINPDRLIIKGRVLDAKTGKPLQIAVLKIGCSTIKASIKGEYLYETTKSVYKYFFIEAICYSYKSVDAKYLDIQDKDELQIDFYLAEYDNPILNCEGCLND